MLNPHRITDSLSLRKEITHHVLGMTEWTGQFSASSKTEIRETALSYLAAPLKSNTSS